MEYTYMKNLSKRPQKTYRRRRKGGKILLLVLIVLILAAVAVLAISSFDRAEVGEKALPVDHVGVYGRDVWENRLYIGVDFVSGSNDILVLPYAEYEDLYAEYVKSDVKAYVRSVAIGETPTDILRNSICYSVPSAGKKIALTFDDGPYPRLLDQYLDILAKYNVKATFFCLGSLVQSNPEAAKKIVAGGHELATHSWGHSQLTKLSAAELKNDFAKTSAAVYEAIGYAPYMFRPPYGSIDDDVKAAAAESGMLAVCWNVDTEDWRAKSADAIVNECMRAASDGAIILMHENKELTVAALPRVIEGLQNKGYELVTVGELIYSSRPEE